MPVRGQKVLAEVEIEGGDDGGVGPAIVALISSLDKVGISVRRRRVGGAGCQRRGGNRDVVGGTVSLMNASLVVVMWAAGDQIAHLNTPLTYQRSDQDLSVNPSLFPSLFGGAPCGTRIRRERFGAWPVPGRETTTGRADTLSPPRLFTSVDIKFVRKFKNFLPLPVLKETPGREKMVVIRRVSRLSVQPVSEEEWKIVERLRTNPAQESGAA
ncbi:MAG: hypothetical protein JWQ98_3534 [Chlorobi bacterium]|nr:hypothetical protein [Chlorobiota bacterium]